MIMCYDRHTIANNGVLHYVARSATNTHEIGVRFKYHGDGTTARMKLVRSIWQSCSIIVGIATDELNLERNGKMNGMKSLCTGLGLKSGVW